MAVTQFDPQLKVRVVVNGACLEEYVDEDEEQLPHTVTKYVEAVSGAQYSIDVELQEPWPEYSIKVDIFTDGNWVRGTFFTKKDFVGSSAKLSITGAKHSDGQDWYNRKFCFSDIIVDDTGTHGVEDQLMKDLKRMGEITVKAYHVSNLRPSDTVIRQKDVRGVGVVPEKVLKGRTLSHQSSLHPPVKTTSTTVFDFEYVDPAKHPFAEYIFKYRSRAALQSLLIIPRSPEPVPLEERDVDTLTPEELREELRRQRERNTAAAAVKREVGVKRERGRERSSTADGLIYDDDELSFVSAKRRRLPITLNEDGTETIDLT